jgi:GMP synthase-like glutamine amidotransferase
MLHIIQNDPEVPPGNISENLEAAGILYCIHYPYLGDPLPELRDVSALIVLGGAMGANDDSRHPFLYGLKIFIRQVVRAGIPYLGICLGGQLLAAALGAAVAPNRWDELGSLQVALTDEGRGDPLFSCLPPEFVTFQWHHDSFDIPVGGTLLAGSSACRHQAFRVGERAWGLQFHPEVTEKIIRDWCRWDTDTAQREEELAGEWRSHQEGYERSARELLYSFLALGGF